MLTLSGAGAIGLVTAVIGLAILLGGSVAVLFAYFKKTTKDILRVENSDLRDRLATVETSDKECKIRLAKAEATIKTLTEVFSGHSAVVELKALVDENHQKVMAKLDELRVNATAS